MRFLSLLLMVFVVGCTAYKTNITERAVRSTLKVINVGAGGHGSGVMVGEDLVLTNAHVCTNPQQRLTLKNSKDELVDAKVLWISNMELTDLCLVRAEENEWKWYDIKFADRMPRLGDDVFTVGNPLIAEFHISWGKISNLDEEGYLWMDMNVQPGNSGGPIFNIHGELVGLVNSVLAQPSGSGKPIGIGISRGPSLEALLESLVR